MADIPKLADFFSTKTEAEDFMLYLEGRGLKEFGLGQGAARFGIDSGTIEQFSKVRSREILSVFKEYFLRMKIVKLSIAFEPRGEFVHKVKKWLSANFSPEVLVDLEVNKKLIGGAIVIANNHYRDYSVQSKIEPFSN